MKSESSYVCSAMLLLWKTREAFKHKLFGQFRFNSSNSVMAVILTPIQESWDQLLSLLAKR